MVHWQGRFLCRSSSGESNRRRLQWLKTMWLGCNAVASQISKFLSSWPHSKLNKVDDMRNWPPYVIDLCKCQEQQIVGLIIIIIIINVAYLAAKMVLTLLYTGLGVIILLVLFFKHFSYFWRQCSVTVVFPVCPGCLWTTQTLSIGTDKACSSIHVTDLIR